MLGTVFLSLCLYLCCNIFPLPPCGSFMFKPWTSYCRSHFPLWCHTVWYSLPCNYKGLEYRKMSSVMFVLLNILVFRWRRVGWVVHVACTDRENNKYMQFSRQSSRERSCWKYVRKSERNIRLDLREQMCEDWRLQQCAFLERRRIQKDRWWMWRYERCGDDNISNQCRTK